MKIKRFAPAMLLLLSLCLLSACGGPGEGEHTPNGNATYTESGGSYEIGGYVADMLTWSDTPVGPQLYYVNPDFLLGDAFAEYGVEGGAEWAGEDRKAITFDFTSYPQGEDSMTGVAWSFTVQLEEQRVSTRERTGEGQEELSPGDEAVIQMGQTLAEIMTAAEQYADALEQ